MRCNRQCATFTYNAYGIKNNNKIYTEVKTRCSEFILSFLCLVQSWNSSVFLKILVVCFFNWRIVFGKQNQSTSWIIPYLKQNLRDHIISSPFFLTKIMLQKQDLFKNCISKYHIFWKSVYYFLSKYKNSTYALWNIF